MPKKPVIKTPEDRAAEIIAAMDADFHTQPDRVIAVVGAAYLETMIDDVLRAAFLEGDEAQSLLRPEGALGAHLQKCQVARTLDLITAVQYQDLKLIAKIRNEFAHNFSRSSFEDQPVRDYCVSLQQPELMAQLAYTSLPASHAELGAAYVRDNSRTPREQFRVSVFALFGTLHRRVRYLQRTQSSRWFTQDPEAAAPVAGV